MTVKIKKPIAQMKTEFPSIDKDVPGLHVLNFIVEVEDSLHDKEKSLSDQTIIKIILVHTMVKNVYYSKEFREFEKHVVDGSFMNRENDKNMIRNIHQDIEYVESLLGDA